MCPICSNSNFAMIGLPRISEKAAGIIKQDYKVVKCNSCSMYYVNPEINFSKNEWEYLYGDDYFLPMTKWHEKRRHIDRKRRFENLAKYCSSEIKNFLDVGAGEGFGLLEAEFRGWNAFGVDISDNRIESAKQESIRFINKDLIRAQLPSNFFDAVYMDSVLEHVLNPYEYLVEIKRIMKKGGILYIGIPNEDSLFNDVKKIAYKILGNNLSSRLTPFKTPYHVVGFNKKSIILTLQKADLKVKKIRNFASRLELLKAKPFSKDFLKLLLVFPIDLLAVPIRREVYFEAYIEKG